MHSTEFIVYENLDSDTQDDFLYKVIFYLTTGKVMIQGKAYNNWCREHFSQCLETVNELCNKKSDLTSNVEEHDSEETLLKEVVSPKPKSQKTQKTVISNEETLLLKVVSPESKSEKVKAVPAIEHKSDNCSPVSYIDDSIFIQEIKEDSNVCTTDKRLDIFEDRLLQISEKMSKIIENKDQSVTTIIKKQKTKFLGRMSCQR